VRPAHPTPSTGETPVPPEILFMKLSNSASSQNYLKPMCNQKTIFVILSAAKNLFFKAAEILHSAALRSE
jgi:hypothetical protein